ncbi:MAG TPA: TlpA disulfide reductase family protein [Chthonomonadales bacterium]|nr:TlpA disulfide reductase family protein [Chthonomonadales bacterium]
MHRKVWFWLPAALVGVWLVFEIMKGGASVPVGRKASVLPEGGLRDQGPAPELTIGTASGPTRLSSLKGKVVLIDFWATWCSPCRMSIPGVQRLYEKYRGQGFDVMGVAIEHDDGSRVPEFVQAMGMTYPVGLPTSRQEIMDYSPDSLPMMVLVDKKGHIRWIQSGYGGGTEDLLEEKIQTLLKE